MANHYMTEVDYATKFAFKTVFYKSAYSYCCCPCGFEHEFVDMSEIMVTSSKKYTKISWRILWMVNVHN